MEFYKKKNSTFREEEGGSHLNVGISLPHGKEPHLDSKGIAFLLENIQGSETQTLCVCWQFTEVQRIRKNLCISMGKIEPHFPDSLFHGHLVNPL